MKLVDKYAQLVNDIVPTDEEAEFIGRFSADMAYAKVAGDEELQHKFLAALVLSLPEDVVMKVGHVLDEISSSGDMEKAAFDWSGAIGGIGRGLKSVGSAAGKGLILGTSAAAIPALIGVTAKAIGKKLDAATSDHGALVLSNVFEKHPDLRHNVEQVTANYATIQKFSPTLAKDPNAAGALLSNINQLGHGGMTYHVLSDLAKMESSVSKSHSDAPGGFFSQFGKELGHGASGIGSSIGARAVEQSIFPGGGRGGP